MCRDEKLPTKYLCGVNCPANPGAWKLHGSFHKKVRKQRKATDRRTDRQTDRQFGRKTHSEQLEDGGAEQQRHREVAERTAQLVEQTGDEYWELLAKGLRYICR